MIPPFVVNESSSIEHAGAIDVFRTVSDLEQYLEPWYVEEPHFIFDCQGLQLEIEPSGTNVRLKAKIPHCSRPEIARHYFSELLTQIAEAKGWPYVGVTEDYLKTASLGQIADQCSRFATP